MLCPSSWLHNTNLEKAIKGQAEELTLPSVGKTIERTTSEMGPATTRCRDGAAQASAMDAGVQKKTRMWVSGCWTWGRDQCGACSGAPLDDGAWPRCNARLGAAGSGAWPAMAGPQTDREGGG